MNENEISYKVIGEALQTHTLLGPGLLEKVYCECLYHKLKQLGLDVQREFPIPVVFDKIKMDCGYRADMIVNNKVIIEVKAIEGLADIHAQQLLTYLKFADCKLGILINFNVLSLKNGFRRVVNKL